MLFYLGLEHRKGNTRPWRGLTPMSFYLGSELMECCIYSPQRLIPMSIQLGSEHIIFPPYVNNVLHLCHLA